MGMLDKVKGLVKGREAQVSKVMDKAGAAINKQTKGKYADQIDSASGKVGQTLGLPENTRAAGTNPAAAANPPAATPPAATPPAATPPMPMPAPEATAAPVPDPLAPTNPAPGGHRATDPDPGTTGHTHA